MMTRIDRIADWLIKALSGAGLIYITNNIIGYLVQANGW